MADPQRYVVSYDFSNFEENNPTAPKPGVQLDTQFVDIQDSQTSIVNAIMDVRRSDGALQNGIVTEDSLAVDLVDLITTETAADAAAAQDAATAAAASAASAASHDADLEAAAAQLSEVADLIAAGGHYGDYGSITEAVGATTDYGTIV